MKTSTYGPQSIETAITHNSLGELYIKMNRLSEAEENLKTAASIRSRAGPDYEFDAAVSRENLAQVYEMSRRLDAAKKVRLSGAPKSIVCAYYYCPGTVFSLRQLSTCARCKSLFYCSETCQRKDWKMRHKQYCKAA